MTTIQTLRNGHCIVMRTDTIYGILAVASIKEAVEYVYKIKGRDFNKPCIVLVSNSTDIPTLNKRQRLLYDHANDEQPTSLIVPKTSEPDWLTRGAETVAYRTCSYTPLRDLIEQTGPLIAPSANPQGCPPAHSINKAKAYFNDKVAEYVDGGSISYNAKPSRLMEFNSNTLVHVAR